MFEPYRKVQNSSSLHLLLPGPQTLLVSAPGPSGFCRGQLDPTMYVQCHFSFWPSMGGTERGGRALGGTQVITGSLITGL